MHNPDFYNEPPFAERVLALTSQMGIPQSAQDEVVDAILTCAAGNQYGVSRAAFPTYEKIIKNFSPREVRLMLQADRRPTTLASRLREYKQCRDRFSGLVKLLDPESVSAPDRPAYAAWLA